MNYHEVKKRLLQQFDSGKIERNRGEWGFLNELAAKDVKVIGYATNISPSIIKRAAQLEVDLLLTHHDAWDFVFGLKERCLRLLEGYGMSHGYFHALLDDAPFGTYASLAAALGIEHLQQTAPYGDDFQAGGIGTLKKPISFDELASILETILAEPVRRYANGKHQIQKICIVTGGGNMTTDMKYAVEAGCDAYITGEYSLYSQQYAELTGMSLFIGSHTNTEILGTKSLGERVIINTGMKLVRIMEENY